MLEIIAEDVLVGIVVVRAEGRLTADDYKAFRKEVDRLVALHGPVDLIMDLRALEGFSPLGALADLRFDATHQADFRHIAVVGDARMLEEGAKLKVPFLKPDTRYFDSIQPARDWLSEVRRHGRDSG